MKTVICKHRDCTIEFTPDKTRYKFCCKDCYRIERNKALYESNKSKKKRQIEAGNALQVMAEQGDEWAIARLRLIELEKEYEDLKAYKKLCCEIEDYFGGEIEGEYTSKEIAEFFGISRCTVDNIIKKFVDDVRSGLKSTHL